MRLTRPTKTPDLVMSMNATAESNRLGCRNVLGVAFAATARFSR
jgi:hypothetical protein